MKKIAAAALIVLLAGQSQGLQCKGTDPNSLFRSGCSWCYCENDRPVCMPDVIPDEPRCTGNPEFSYGKGWCKCVDGMVSCNPTNAAEAQPQCLDTSSTLDEWRDGGLWCYCTDQKYTCYPTQGALDGSDTSECRKTPAWRKNKSWCTCVAGKSVCYSDSEYQLKSAECKRKDIITDIWRDEDGCNECRCLLDNKALCTKKTCSQGQIEKPACSGHPKWRKKESRDWCICTEQGPLCSPEVMP